MLTRLGALAFSGLGLVGAEQVSSGGPDLQGIALIITSVSGLIATVGALVIGLRRKPSDGEQTAEIIKAILDAQQKDEP